MTLVMTREERIEALVEKWGPNCFSCGNEFKEEVDITFDHWIPQCAGGTWDIENLRLMHKRCNALKGDLIPVDDVTVPKRPEKPLASRSITRAARPEVCEICDSGRKVGYGENCGACGSGPMPEVFPQFAKVKANECDHDLFWCWACSIGIHPRKAAIVTVLDGEYLDDELR